MDKFVVLHKKRCLLSIVFHNEWDKTSFSWCVRITGYVDRCDIPFAFMLWSSCIFSWTALLFHDLTDREPLKYIITVRTGYNPSRLQENGFQVYTVKKDLHEIGITTMLTSFGHSVPVYDMERTICDLLRSRKNIEMQVFQEALKQYAKRKDKNLRMLMKYATMFHVEKILRPYLEVLL